MPFTCLDGCGGVLSCCFGDLCEESTDSDYILEQNFNSETFTVTASSITAAFLFTYNALLLNISIILAYATRNVNPEYNESATLFLGSIAVALGVGIVVAVSEGYGGDSGGDDGTDVFHAAIVVRVFVTWLCATGLICMYFMPKVVEVLRVNSALSVIATADSCNTHNSAGNAKIGASQWSNNGGGGAFGAGKYINASFLKRWSSSVTVVNHGRISGLSRGFDKRNTLDNGGDHEFKNNDDSLTIEVAPALLCTRKTKSNEVEDLPENKHISQQKFCRFKEMVKDFI
ncbi:hypothetical protein HK100_008579 [Physocladia obscura]|uniref:G-protein coupled receptors family 3 profile domain-containing protein n=1 Tax=Physocladia obscura TaxID=109957 RepID=A0AAD5XL06_9FUNG|nr:hypothetical protein HK100_008579 [Physocladia obscura]